MQAITFKTLEGKYQRIEAEFYTKEITEYKATLQKFKDQFTYLSSVLKATGKPEDRRTAELLESFLGSA